MADLLPTNPTVRVTRLDRWTGPCLFWVSFAFLAILAGMLCSFSIEVAQLARFVPAASAHDRDAGTGRSADGPATAKSAASVGGLAAVDDLQSRHLRYRASA